ncbi:MAG: helicase, partial [Nitrospinae bacterium]|nr:helicase [Nitrospinota bacterium]
MKRIIYLDIETQKGPEDVGGWQNKHLMRMAVGVIYDSLEGDYFTFLEKDVDQLIER